MDRTTLRHLRGIKTQWNCNRITGINAFKVQLIVFCENKQFLPITVLKKLLLWLKNGWNAVESVTVCII